MKNGYRYFVAFIGTIFIVMYFSIMSYLDPLIGSNGEKETLLSTDAITDITQDYIIETSEVEDNIKDEIVEGQETQDTIQNVYNGGIVEIDTPQVYIDSNVVTRENSDEDVEESLLNDDKNTNDGIMTIDNSKNTQSNVIEQNDPIQEKYQSIYSEEANVGVKEEVVKIEDEIIIEPIIETMIVPNVIIQQVSGEIDGKYRLFGTISEKNVEEISILSCDGNFSGKYDSHWYTLKDFISGGKSFTYNISESYNNTCAIAYKIKLIYRNTETEEFKTLIKKYVLE